MGMIRDLQYLFGDVRRWYYKAGGHKVVYNIKHQYYKKKRQRQYSNKQSSYDKLCDWLKQEIKK